MNADDRPNAGRVSSLWDCRIWPLLAGIIEEGWTVEEVAFGIPKGLAGRISEGDDGMESIPDREEKRQHGAECIWEERTMCQVECNTLLTCRVYQQGS